MNKERLSISILGCGWLGVPLARHFINKGWSVKGSVTSTDKFGLLRSQGILPFRIVVSDTEVLMDDPDFFHAHVLIISIPPARTEDVEQVFPSRIRRLIPFILHSGIQKVIFISSTSVYPEQNQVAREEDQHPPDKASGKALLVAENLLKEQSSFQTTIIRFGGLIGVDRNPARFLSKAFQPIANAPVNLIHQDDCIGIITGIIVKEIWGETFNACCPEHPMKKDFYTKAALQTGYDIPEMTAQDKAYKMVDSSKLIRRLNYHFIYPNPMDYLITLSKP